LDGVLLVHPARQIKRVAPSVKVRFFRPTGPHPRLSP
jgi:hypothetical protein